MAVTKSRKPAATTKPKPVSAAAKRAAENEEDLTRYADKPPTDLQQRFGDWLLEKVDPEVENEGDFLEGVRLATALRMKFQASPENQAVIAENKNKAASKGDDEEEEKPAPKRRGRKPAPKAEEPEVDEVDEDLEDDEDAEEPEDVEESEDVEDEPEPAPKARARRTAGPKPAGTAKTGRPAAKSAGATRTPRKAAAPF